MMLSNNELQGKIRADAEIFRAVRRSDFSMQIRLKMLEKGLKNVDLAERLGVSEANISRWLRGNQNLGIDTMYQLADAIEESLTITVGTQAAMADASVPVYQSFRAESVLLGSEEEAAASLGASSANVIYASFRKRNCSYSRTEEFLAANCEISAEYEELMVK